MLVRPCDVFHRHLILSKIDIITKIQRFELFQRKALYKYLLQLLLLLLLLLYMTHVMYIVCIINIYIALFFEVTQICINYTQYCMCEIYVIQLFDRASSYSQFVSR